MEKEGKTSKRRKTVKDNKTCLIFNMEQSDSGPVSQVLKRFSSE